MSPNNLNLNVSKHIPLTSSVLQGKGVKASKPREEDETAVTGGH